MAFKPPVPVPTPLGMAFKPPQRPSSTGGTSAPNQALANAAQGITSGGGAKAFRPSSAPQRYRPNPNENMATGGGGFWPAAGKDDITSPWEKAMRQNYDQASGPVPYQGEWKQGVAQAMQLGGRDYEGALRGFAQEDVQRQIDAANSQLGALGMRELGLAKDVQADRGKMRADASTRAMMDSQQMKQQALQTMQGMLQGASGAELDRIAQMMQAGSAGSSAYTQFQNLAVPLQEKFGQNRADFAARSPAGQRTLDREQSKLYGLPMPTDRR